VVRYVGPSVEHLFGYTRDEVLGASAFTYVCPQYVEKFRERWEQAIAVSSGDVHVEFEAWHKDGTPRWVHARLTNLLSDADVRGVVLNIRDVTRRRQADIARADREQLHREILETAQEGVWAVGHDGRTLFANAKMAELLGTTTDDFSRQPVWEFFDTAARDVVRQHLPLRSQGISDHYELEVITGSGERRWLRVAGSPLHDSEGNHIGNLGMFADITHRRHLEQELARLALYDSLTSLPNRALLFDRLQRLQVDAERTGDDLAVLFCDIDRFAEVNQARGHAVADELLRALADRLHNTVRESDTVARFGGDEFVILCPGTDSLRARDLATDICMAAQAPFDIAGERIYVSVSVGVAATPASDRDDLLGAAANARSHAQELGRARVEVHDATTQTGSEDRLRMLVDLQDALERDELAMYYQPIVRLNDGKPTGVEALMRWNHRVLGPTSPAKFIPVAEDGGLMPRLGAWSLRRSCAEAMQAPYPEADLWYLAVNMSTCQLADGAVLDVVRGALEDTGFPAHRLLLEVTETAVVTDSTQAISTLRAIRDLGVRIAIDDFGTGYSSLSYLRQFPVDTIKIDRSFVSGMTTDTDDLAVVASIVSLAAAVGVQAVAEGVETEDQADALRRLGCPLAQGFLWSPAVPASDLTETLSAIARRRGQSSDAKGTARERRPRKPRSPSADEAVVARIIALHQSGASLTTIAAALNADNLTTERGLRWHRSSVARVIADRQFPGMTTVR
jgi:diguanylate cyclase (GGDEF)-like protein/PAS domain S-box-containing protein